MQDLEFITIPTGPELALLAPLIRRLEDAAAAARAAQAEIQRAMEAIAPEPDAIFDPERRAWFRRPAPESVTTGNTPPQRKVRG